MPAISSSPPSLPALGFLRRCLHPLSCMSKAMSATLCIYKSSPSRISTTDAFLTTFLPATEQTRDCFF